MGAAAGVQTAPRRLPHSLTNIRITTFFASEHEVRVLDPSRVELLAAIGCEVAVEG